MERVVKKFLKWCKPFVKPVLIVSGIITIGMLAIFRANFNYIDDLGRAAAGYKGWGNFSRYLSNALAMVLHGNNTLTDISPWGQIIAILLMAISGVMLLHIIYDRTKFRWWELFAVSILALNPYFLECLSYKFDAPFMAVSVLGMILPFLAMKQKSGIYIGAVFVGTLTTCLTYQAALGILPMIAIVLTARMWGHGKDWKTIGKFVGKTLVGYGAGLAFFKIFLMREIVDGYVTTGAIGIMDIVPQAMENLRTYYRLMIADFAKTWLILIAIITIWFVIAMTVKAKQRKWLACVVALATILLLGITCLGIYVVMQQPLFAPRAMFGIGVMICLMAIIVVEEWKPDQKWQQYLYGIGMTAVLALAYLFGIFSFTYGNALAVQKEYANFRTEAVVNDLESLVQEGNIVEVTGSIGLSPALEMSATKYPILARLVPVGLSDGYWGRYKLMRYYGMRELERDLVEAAPNAEDYPILEEHWHHNLRMKDGVIVVELKQRP